MSGHHHAEIGMAQEIPVVSPSPQEYLAAIVEHGDGINGERLRTVDEQGALTERVNNISLQTRLFEIAVQDGAQAIEVLRQKISIARSGVEQINQNYLAILDELTAIGNVIRRHDLAIEAINQQEAKWHQELIERYQALDELREKIARLEQQYQQEEALENGPQTEQSVLHMQLFAAENGGSLPSSLTLIEVRKAQTELRRIFGEVRQIETEDRPRARRQKETEKQAIESIVSDRWEPLDARLALVQAELRQAEGIERMLKSEQKKIILGHIATLQSIYDTRINDE